MFDQYKYQNNYNREKYVRITLNFKKEEKISIEEHAAKKGFNSVNDYIKDLIRKDMNENTMGVNIKQSGAFNNIKIGK